MTTDDDSDELAERFERLHQASLTHPARLAMVRWDAWGIVASAMATNERQLLEAIEAPTEDQDLAIEIMRNVGGSGIGKKFIGDVYRLLHNYLASVATLVYHSRNLLRHYPDSNFVQEYERRLKTVRSEPVTKFVQDLRNVLVHHGLPNLRRELTFSGSLEGAEGTFTIRLDRDQLLGIERFTTEARTYLEAQDEEFPLRDPIAHYAGLVAELNSWIAVQFEPLHQRELEDYDALIDQMRPPRRPPQSES